MTSMGTSFRRMNEEAPSGHVEGEEPTRNLGGMASEEAAGRVVSLRETFGGQQITDGHLSHGQDERAQRKGTD